MTHRIPCPPGVPILGNLTSIDTDMPTDSFLLLTKKYGEIYKLKILGAFSSALPIESVRTDLLITTHTGVKLVVVNSYELQHEVSNDSRFKKVVVDTLAEIRRVAGDGLFTSVLPYVVSCVLVNHSDGLSRAHLEEPNWEIAREYASG
jgi:cytochrome P450/NADPH-cytochrome P450 reductase